MLKMYIIIINEQDNYQLIRDNIFNEFLNQAYAIMECFSIKIKITTLKQTSYSITIIKNGTK